MVPETVALGHRGGAGDPGAVGSGPSSVAASSGSQGGETCQAPSPWGQSLGGGGRGCRQRGRLFLSTSSSSPGGAPSRGTGRVRPLRSLAEADSDFATRPESPPTHPSPGASRGEGAGAEEGREAEPGRGRPHPVLVLRLGSAPSPTTETWEDRAGQRSARWLSRQGPALLPARPRRPRPASRRLFSSSPGLWSLGLGVGLHVAVGGAPGPGCGWERGAGRGGCFRFPAAGEGAGPGPCGSVGSGGRGGDGACALAVGSSVSVVARPAGLCGQPGPPGLRRGRRRVERRGGSPGAGLGGGKAGRRPELGSGGVKAWGPAAGLRGGGEAPRDGPPA